ncbi:hypothetical protein [Ureibacillus thermosphaericus]|uniref:hypothetical protein n=1 Tax=Ureibacillus thermosphaericus TaxID=51173 RepID=UPI000BBC6649|nr:hypothetical protein [Ureibacillus thermosphaericus]
MCIDEYPDLLVPIAVTNQEIGQLWTDIYEYGFPETDEFASRLRTMLNQYSNDYKVLEDKEMVFIDFRAEKFDKYKETVGNLLKKVKKKEHKELLFKFQQILNNGCYYYENAFHTFDSSAKFVMLECNIILDANADYDYRYSLSNKFLVKKQPKFYDYSQTEFFHYELDTSKKALTKYINLTENVLKEISLEGRSGVLFITDKENKEQVEQAIEDYFNNKLEGVKETPVFSVSTDYFGNLVGKNCYRTLDTVIVLKTPNFNYLTYALTNFFYKFHDNLAVGTISIFKDEDVERIRISTIAGEFYQGIRRISRDNPADAKIYVFTNNQKAIDTVLEQLPNIKYNKYQINVEKRGKEQSNKIQKELTEFEKKIAEVKSILIKAKQSGTTSIKKKELRSQVDISDKSNFSKILKALQPFLRINKIESNGQKLIFK